MPHQSIDRASYEVRSARTLLAHPRKWAKEHGWTYDRSSDTVTCWTGEKFSRIPYAVELLKDIERSLQPVEAKPC